MNEKDKEAFWSFWNKYIIDSLLNKIGMDVWQAACLHKQKEIDELKDRLHYEVEMIDGAANDHIKKLESENAKLREVISYLPKIPTEPYEKELSKKIQKLEEYVDKLEVALEKYAGYLGVLDEEII